MSAVLLNKSDIMAPTTGFATSALERLFGQSSKNFEQRAEDPFTHFNGRSLSTGYVIAHEAPNGRVVPTSLAILASEYRGKNWHVELRNDDVSAGMFYSGEIA